MNKPHHTLIQTETMKRSMVHLFEIDIDKPLHLFSAVPTYTLISSIVHLFVNMLLGKKLRTMLFHIRRPNSIRRCQPMKPTHASANDSFHIPVRPRNHHKASKGSYSLDIGRPNGRVAKGKNSFPDLTRKSVQRRENTWYGRRRHRRTKR